jgi:small subunit ribosomal protein S16
MSVKLRLMRLGKKKQPTYRIVAINSTSPQRSNYLEKIGNYYPFAEKDKKLVFDAKRFQYWLQKGAELSKGLARIIGNKNQSSAT